MIFIPIKELLVECPKIIFVEGPTGVGKGYFINNLLLQFREKRPNLKISLLEAKTWALDQNSQSEDRKYTAYNTTSDKVENIFNGHIRLLAYIKSLLSSKVVDLVIVDRSFLSFITYNVYKPEDQDLRERYIAEFKEAYHYLGVTEYPSLTVQLISGKPTLKTVSLLEQRIKERGDKKEIDLKWLRVLLYNYNLFRAKDILPTTYHETLTSNDSIEIMQCYFATELN